jgi:hypothetical protein
MEHEYSLDASDGLVERNWWLGHDKNQFYHNYYFKGVYILYTLMLFKKYNWVLYYVTGGNMQLNLDAEYF